MQRKRNSTGIYPIHSRKCAIKLDGAAAKCTCSPTWQVFVPAARPGGKAIRKNYKSKADAIRERPNLVVAVQSGTLTEPSKRALKQAADELLAGMRDGTIRTRSGDRYKPSAIRSYEGALRRRVLPEFGGVRLADVRRRDVQRFIEKMLGQDLSASTIKNAIDPLRVIYRRALKNDEVAVNPTDGIDVPADRGRRDRFATATEAATLIDALPVEQRPLWATAFYTGMRRGELRELRWSDVDLDANAIRVERGLDDAGTVIDVKSRAGNRTVPILAALRPYLVTHKLATGRAGGDLVFGRTATAPFVPSTVRRRAIDAWDGAGLTRIALHECRHSAASMLRAAGLDFKMVQAIIGHSSVTTTFDRYTHLGPDDLTGAAAAMDTYLAGKARSE